MAPLPLHPTVPAMTSVLASSQDRPAIDDEDRPIEVLFTGFGPFSSFQHNPSWLAVKPLHGLTLRGSTFPAMGSTSTTTAAQHQANDMRTDKKRKAVHLQAIQIPVAYSAVLDTVPRIHNNTPRLPPPTAEPWLDPAGAHDGSAGDGRSFPHGYRGLQHVPRSHRRQQQQRSDDDDRTGGRGGGEGDGGYDVVIHVGVGRSGFMRLETRAHKSGYRFRDRRNALAPFVYGDQAAVVAVSADSGGFGREVTQPWTPMQRYEMERLNPQQKGDEPASFSSLTCATARTISKAPEGEGSEDELEPEPEPAHALRRGFPASAYPTSESFRDEERPNGAPDCAADRPVDVQALMNHLRAVLPRIPPALLETHAQVQAKGQRHDQGQLRHGSSAHAPLQQPAEHMRQFGYTSQPMLQEQEQQQAQARAKTQEAVPVSLSADAGLFLCEYIFYASLAESKRAAGQAGCRHEVAAMDEGPEGLGRGEAWRRKRTKVLFVHCPPVGQYMSSEEVRAVLQEIAWWVAVHD
ncbi:hypothetical protein K437DRAFT_266597 [Tilletiaria anomala UBC 951]|uniref:Peptidase C15, pyroglutamyl peptidase I-like protein n=1 Tax=Tilletiaria anomala (strain ATCC 24038 / CBS 436.72 / UBC 951) TaxID=1037660 RepID=A0A066WP71_TILAU|nr:uncharacterized protein K437DRAFT_266597 [Tilletiaria anomala UBC 951]KDN52405.1 hypothetical protein K437DRAFT_266597 [Tilletiaria anomala UBC 951]